jgi:CDP-diacylglycerol--glycerol-3-phosphate 3-phosphatidyltransferase
LTLIGFAGTCLAALAAGYGGWILAGILLAFFSAFDLLDGVLARATDRVSAFGAFLDSTLDRTGENLVLAGVAWGCLRIDFPVGVAAALLALVFAPLVTYARARAETLGARGEVGLAPRPARILLLSGGLILAGSLGTSMLAAALLLVGLLSAITVGQRIFYARRQLQATVVPRSNGY